MTRQKCETPAGDKPAGASEQKNLQCLNGASLGAANETRISQLRAAVDAAAAAGDLATYKQHQADHLKALSARSPEQVHRLDAQHLGAVERAAELGDHGPRDLPAARLEKDASRAVAWRTSRPVADEVYVRRAA